MSRYTNILFDFDGTVMDTSEGIFNSFDYVMDFYGISNPGHEFYKRLIGPPLADSFTNFFGFSPEKAQEAVKKYREFYRPKGLYQVKVYEGVENLLRSLKADGKKLFVATSKPQIFAEDLLKKYKLHDLFDFVGGSEANENRGKKSEVIEYVLTENGITDRTSCIMVGDRMYDVKGATECNMDCLGIEWGFGSREELLDAGAVAVVPAPEDVLSFLEK